MTTPLFLHLVIYQDNPPFNLMQSSLSTFYKQFNNITTLFIIYNPSISTEYLLVDDILYIKGSESKIPGILLKTIDALIYKLNFIENYSFIIRSNISSVVNFKLLQHILFLNDSSKSINYLGGVVHTAKTLAPEDGLINFNDLGLSFASGTLIVLSPLFTLNLIQKRHYLRFSMVDDLAIAIFARDYFGGIVHSISPHLFYWNDQSISLDLRLKLIDERQYKIPPILWRNKSFNRMDDALCLQHICKIIS